ncbi:thioesterase II family protein [Streptomyces sp. CNQ085]|uniref:thioesterase II family protein n=1 Tax=Streptomyces sp. CNQ085 TaxID=2886944 RepID=UPI001F512A56|nr:alpha/beta fold hydrolase [Streptomyces sp. CNQ085]MCI0384728.1 alpha/beta fold hydrolase [Streptomyces sp. CNQ085]
MSWIRTLRTAPPGAVRLVCLPHAGGSAHAYLPLAEALGPGTEVLAAQYPGRHDRLAELPLGDLRLMAGHIAACLGPLRDAPLALFGHSLGALLGYEVAARLQATGPAPVHLFASAMLAPSRHRHGGVHLRDDDGILAELDRLSGTPARSSVEESLLRLMLPAIRGDYRAFETYTDPGHLLSCPVTVFLGDADPLVTPDEARAWARHTTGPGTLRILPGGHFYLTEPGNTAEIARVVSARLADITESARHPAPAPAREGIRT